MTKTEQKYRPVVIQAILDIAEIERPQNPWFCARDVFDCIHGHYGEKHDWLYSTHYKHGHRVPSPGHELVTRIINQLRKTGFLEYNPDSLGQTSEWRIPVLGTHGDYTWNAKRLASELPEIDEGSAAL